MTSHTVWKLSMVPESKMKILRSTERSMVRAMCGVQRIGQDLMLMLGLNVTMDQLAMASSVCWHGHVSMREYGDVLRKTLDFEVECQRKIGRPKRKWKKQIEEESMKVGLRRGDVLCRSKWSVGVNQIAACLR